MGVSTSKPHEVETKYFPDFVKKLPSLEGKTIAITGCTSGTGYVTAQTSIDKGAENVLLLNRPSDRATAAHEKLVNYAKEQAESSQKKKKPTNVDSIACDLQDFASVRKAAQTIQDKYEAIDVLCNNAGVMALNDIATTDGYDVQMQTNHLSHFLLTKELYPLLRRARELRGEARIVHHTSGARQFPSTPLQAKYLEKNGGNLGGNNNSMFWGGANWERYHQTKLANSVMTMALKEKLASSSSSNEGIKATLAAPGLSATNLQVTTAQNGGMSAWDMAIMHMSQSAEDGTMPLLAACFDPSAENGDFWEPSSWGRVRGLPEKVEYDKLSADPEARKLLWEKSEEAVGKFEL